MLFAVGKGQILADLPDDIRLLGKIGEVRIS